MLVTLNEVLKIAEEKEIAIGAFNAANLESLTAIISAAEELELPVILQFAPVHEPLTSLDLIGPVMVAAAKKAAVPVCVHLDHGEDFDYLKKALDMGFTGIMYDGSVLPFEQNLENTQKAVAMAKCYGADVEAELGSMGRREDGDSDGTGTGVNDETKIYTDPQMAREFIQASGIDALACSFGTTHGIYLTEPKLDFDVVKNVRALSDNIPVVMHGGSGVSREDYRKAIKAGVRKVNYFTYMDKAGGEAAAACMKNVKPGTPYFFSAISCAARDAMKENIKSAMKMFAMMD